MFKHILMPTDGSEHSERAVERGIELAKLCGAKVTGIHVLPDYRFSMALDEAMDPLTREEIEELPKWSEPLHKTAQDKRSNLRL